MHDVRTPVEALSVRQPQSFWSVPTSIEPLVRSRLAKRLGRHSSKACICVLIRATALAHTSDDVSFRRDRVGELLSFTEVDAGNWLGPGAAALAGSGLLRHPFASVEIPGYSGRLGSPHWFSDCGLWDRTPSCPLGLAQAGKGTKSWLGVCAFSNDHGRGVRWGPIDLLLRVRPNLTSVCVARPRLSGTPLLSTGVFERFLRRGLPSSSGRL